MTAFAAIVSRGDARPDPAGVARVAQVLATLYRTLPGSLTSDACTLLTASAPERHDPTAERGLICVGQVLLEDAGSRARELGAPPDSSTLTLVRAAYARWGARCTERLSGEYALVVWDARQRVLLAARDGLGIRPLYVAEGTSAIVLSNVLTAALAYPAVSDAVDPHGLVEFIASGGLRPGRTAYRAINSLPAGHTLVFDSGRDAVSMARHWWFPQFTANASSRADDLIAGYRHVLECAVADRTRDHPRASILLSGGVDSATIAAAARAATTTDLRGFTAVYDRVAGGGELPLARAAGDRLGITVMPVCADRDEALHALWHDEPTPQPLDEPTLSGWRVLIRSAGTHSRSALYGADGDALFLPPGFRSLLRQQPAASAFVDVCRYAVAHIRLPYLGLRLRERIGLARQSSATRLPGWLTQEARALLGDREPPSILNLRSTPLPWHPTRPRTQQLLERGVSEYLAVILSPEVTRTAVELRCPLLDSRVLRFVMEIPPIPWCQQKHLPRRAYRGILPDAIVDRPKTGLAGVDEALARAWQHQRRDARAESLRPPLDAWVDRARWRAALDSSDMSSVGAAWRVLQLDAWLTRRHELVATPDSLCTP